MKTSIEKTYNAYIGSILADVQGMEGRAHAAKYFRLALENLEKDLRQSAVSKAYDLATLLAKGE